MKKLLLTFCLFLTACTHTPQYYFYIYYAKTYDTATAGSLLFIFLIGNELLYSLSCRNLKKSVINIHIFDNKRLTIGIFSILIIQIIVLTTSISKYFIVTNLSLKSVLFIIGACLFNFIIGELIKPIYNKLFKDYNGGKNE